MDTIKYKTKLKASGKEYKKIVFWNRFIRNPIETILSWIPAAICVALITLGYFNTYLAVIYAACFAYPIYIFFFQFESSVKYHLSHRDPSEDADCYITLMDSGILADIEEFELQHSYDWSSFKTIYNKFGYYMFFDESKMTLMLRINDMSEEQKKAVPEYIKGHVNQNICKILF